MRINVRGANVTDKEIEEWQALKLEGYAGEEIAEMYGRAYQTVNEYTLPVLKVYELTHGDGRVATGTVREIAKEWSVSEGTIRRYLGYARSHKRGLRVREKGNKIAQQEEV